ncbi:MAG: T9SS type A sorting domain-containing protein [Candidatus Sabulitectum sp.]|nr:T9SS type A sorting domain-containing protein [Candidatus Sabulitectum sp.]
MFHNGPAGNSYNWGRQSFYGITGTPTVKIDGLAASSSSSSYNAAINTRLAVPCHMDIDVNMVGDENGGTAFVSVTAEQAPAAGTIKVWTVILEDHEVATSAWGGYNGHEMMWIPVAYPLNGTVLNFTGSYPQTIQVSGNYTLNSSQHPYDDLNVATYVQFSTGTKEVLNASFIDLHDTSTGIYDVEELVEVTSSVLNAWPNPSTGTFAVSSFVPSGTTGTVEIFDIAGRSIYQFTAGSIENIRIEETGVYFIRLTANTGEVVNTQVAVIR